MYYDGWSPPESSPLLPGPHPLCPSSLSSSHLATWPPEPGLNQRSEVTSRRLTRLLPPQCTCWGIITQLIRIKLQPTMIIHCFHTFSFPPSIPHSPDQWHWAAVVEFCGCTRTAHGGGRDLKLEEYFRIINVLLCFSGCSHPQQLGCPLWEEREVQGGGASVQESAGDQREGGSKVAPHRSSWISNEGAWRSSCFSSQKIFLLLLRSQRMVLISSPNPFKLKVTFTFGIIQRPT